MFSDLKLGKIYDGMLYLAESVQNPQMARSHHHIELELNLVLRGTITYVVHGRRYTFSPRTLLWLFPGQEHQLVDRADNAQFYVAVFKPSLIKRACRTTLYDGLTRTPPQAEGILNTLLKPGPMDLICKTMETLMQGSLDPDLLNREAGYGPDSDFHFEHRDPDCLNAGLHYLLVLCWRIYLAGESAAGSISLHPVVRRALKLMGERDSDRSLDELAKACGATKAHLSRTFHREVGVPWNRYRNYLRLSRFFEENEGEEKKTLAEAVYAAGFGSYAQFYKVFTQAYGRAPSSVLKKPDMQG